MKNLNSMLELQKYVISNVSNNDEIMKREIEKSFRFLEPVELDDLMFWLESKYGDKVYSLIDQSKLYSR